MSNNPLNQLLVPESEVPGLQRKYDAIKHNPKPTSKSRLLAQERNERRLKTHKQKNACRRISVGGAVVDVLGEGRYARIWIGRNSDNHFCSLTAREMSELIAAWREAIA